MSTESHHGWSPRRKILIIAVAVLLAVVIAPYLKSVIFPSVYPGLRSQRAVLPVATEKVLRIREPGQNPASSALQSMLS